MKPTISILLITLGLTFPASAIAQSHSFVFEDGSAFTCRYDADLSQTKCRHETMEQRVTGMDAQIDSLDKTISCTDLYESLDPRPDLSGDWWDKCMGRK